MPGVQQLLPIASRKFRDVVATLQDDDWNQPTLCDVPVRELVEHVLAGNEFAVRLLAGAGADEARDGIDDIRIGLDPVAQVVRSCDEQMSAFFRADQARLLHHPSGEIDFGTFAWIRVGDVAIHAWDIATATGGDRTLDPVLVKGLWELVEPNRARMQAMGVYGVSSGAVSRDADLQDRLLGAYGRTSP